MSACLRYFKVLIQEMDLKLDLGFLYAILDLFTPENASIMNSEQEVKYSYSPSVFFSLSYIITSTYNAVHNNFELLCFSVPVHVWVCLVRVFLCIPLGGTV